MQNLEGWVSLQKRLDALEAVALARMQAELRVVWLDFSIEELEAIAGREGVDEEFRDAALAKLRAAASPELRRALWME